VKTSEKINEIAGALVQAQAQMGAAFKDNTNPHYKSGFASLASVILTVKEPLHNNGLSFVQPTIRTDGFVGCETRIMHTSGQWMEGELTLPLTKQDPQAAGSAITYARRYSLMSMLGLPTTDDDAESAIEEDEEDEVEPSVYIDDMQLKIVTDLLEETHADIERFCANFQITSVNKMPKEKLDRAIAALNRKKESVSEEKKNATTAKEVAA
jgi:hypothetical protein